MLELWRRYLIFKTLKGEAGTHGTEIVIYKPKGWGIVWEFIMFAMGGKL